MTDTQYMYQKERKEFGKQCLFSDKKFLMVSIPPNHDEFNDYILRNPVEEGTQLSRQFALSEVNTVSTTTESKGILHTEGGWPKDVNYQDTEQTLRYRRKLEKDDTYITQVPRMGEVRNRRRFPLQDRKLTDFLSFSQRVEFCILQNNAVNIYEEYFDGLEPAPIVDRSHSRTMFVYKDVETPTVGIIGNYNDGSGGSYWNGSASSACAVPHVFFKQSCSSEIKVLAKVLPVLVQFKHLLMLSRA